MRIVHAGDGLVVRHMSSKITHIVAAPFILLPTTEPSRVGSRYRCLQTVDIWTSHAQQPSRLVEIHDIVSPLRLAAPDDGAPTVNGKRAGLLPFVAEYV